MSVITRPPPWHIPLIAISTSFGQRSSCTNGVRSRPSVSRSISCPPSCFPPISPPTQKYSPLAVTTRTSTAGSRLASTAAFLMPWYISMVSALRRSGRSITTRNTPSPFLACRWREPRSTDVMPGSSDDLGAAQLGDLRGREAELAQHVVRVLADDGREPLDADRVPGHLDRRP